MPGGTRPESEKTMKKTELRHEGLFGKALEDRLLEGDWPCFESDALDECAALVNGTSPALAAGTSLAEVYVNARALVRALGVDYPDDSADLAGALWVALQRVERSGL